MENNQVAVTNQNQVQAPTGLPHLKSGDEKYELAVQGNKIITAPIEELKEVLRLVMLKLGLRGQNLPDAEEKVVLLNHIAEHYGSHTAEEIKLAFDLAISGKLNVDVRTFENFSCLYFSSVMNAYREWSKEHFYNLEQKKRRLSLPYNQRGSLSEEEMQDWINETNIDEIKTYHFAPVDFYDYLVLKGLLVLTVEQKNEYFKKAISEKNIEYLNSEERNAGTVYSQYYRKSVREFKEAVENNEFRDGLRNQLQNTAKKIAVFDYLKNKSNEMSEPSE